MSETEAVYKFIGMALTDNANRMAGAVEVAYDVDCKVEESANGFSRVLVHASDEKFAEIFAFAKGYVAALVDAK